MLLGEAGTLPTPGVNPDYAEPNVTIPFPWLVMFAHGHAMQFWPVTTKGETPGGEGCLLGKAF